MIEAMLCVAAFMLVMWAGAEMRPPERTLKANTTRIRREVPLLSGVADVVLRTMRSHKRFAQLGELDLPERKMLGATILIAGVCAFVHPIASLVVLVGGSAVIWNRRRLAKATRKSQIMRELPLMIELTSLLVSCGYNVALALREIQEHLEGPLSEEVRIVLRSVDRGARLGDALDALPARTCEEIRPFVWSLTSTERYGSPLGDVLDRLSLESRALMSARAEQSARKLTVQLLFPVAGCTLPAFALLTVAPFVVSSIRTVASSFT